MENYVGRGLLEGRRALVTGGDLLVNNVAYQQNADT